MYYIDPTVAIIVFYMQWNNQMNNGEFVLEFKEHVLGTGPG